ncbi:penicillin-binding protein activator [Fontimonas sp. SYSU GA230001]|uniref:penicillin-binding protein activator n=1 Tax=Fontimonas sp. SYSU GA230001 TaxID=3142450 RepID=UPI0032B3B29F
MPKFLGFLIAATLASCASRAPVAPPARTVQSQSETHVAVQGHPEPMPAYVEQWLNQPTPGTGIALLLPLSGPFAATAEAVRDGFLARHFAAGGQGSVRVYDVGDGPERLAAAYRLALDEGAGFIVGPLTKEGVAQLAAMQPPVPVLGLNYLDAGTPSPSGFYQFGLAPEDEARAAADDAVARSLRRAVALVPEGDWGARVLAAFEDRLNQAGGRVVAAGRYRQGVSDQKDIISQLMGVAASEERHRALNAALGVKTEFDARRRADIDLVFLAARASDARVLLPQFRFYRASGLPLYATSLIYDGRADADLSGLRFCDMPFMLDAEGDWSRERAEAAGLASAAAYPRLYALGRDAYQIARALQRGELRVGDGYRGASGQMEWAGSSALVRRLDCVDLRADGVVAASRP